MFLQKKRVFYAALKSNILAKLNVTQMLEMKQKTAWCHAVGAIEFLSKYDGRLAAFGNVSYISRVNTTQRAMAIGSPVFKKSLMPVFFFRKNKVLFL